MGGEKFKYFAYSGIAVFILAILFFVVSVYTTMVNGESRSQYEFSSFVQQTNINSYASLQTDSDIEQFLQNMRNNVESNSYIVAVVLSVANDPVFAYPISSNVIQISADQKPILLASSPMLKTYSMSVASQRGQQIILNAVTYLLRPQDIFNAARISFLIILAYTLALIIVIVYLSLSRDNRETAKRIVVEQPNSVNESSNDMPTEPEHETIPIVFREQESSWDEFFVDEEETVIDDDNTEAAVYEDDNSEIIEYKNDTVQENLETTDTYIDSFVDEYLDENNDDVVKGPSKTEEEKNVLSDSAPEEDSTISQITDPMGLFSDITGVGWESYMETRLDSELIRAASSEQDLALLFIQLKGIENNISAKKKIATLLLDYFKFRDFVFEYKDDGFAGILLDVNLDQTMILSEQLFQQIQSILQNEGMFVKVGIGISTRSLRILPGSRIITEAEQAVSRAFEEEELPIVAFRVSPEKYRQFVSNTTT